VLTLEEAAAYLRIAPDDVLRLVSEQGLPGRRVGEDYTGRTPQPAASTLNQALESAEAKIKRLYAAGFDLSRNDRKIVLFGQLLTTIAKPDDAALLAFDAERAIDRMKQLVARPTPTQLTMFD
jgi:excisionase family DNA binding protein